MPQTRENSYQEAASQQSPELSSWAGKGRGGEEGRRKRAGRKEAGRRRGGRGGEKEEERREQERQREGGRTGWGRFT